MVGAKVSIIVCPLMVLVTTVAPIGRDEGGFEGAVVEGTAEEGPELGAPGPGATMAAVGQLFADGWVVYELHPIVGVLDKV